MKWEGIVYLFIFFIATLHLNIPSHKRSFNFYLHFTVKS